MLVLLSDRNLDVIDGQSFADNRYGIVQVTGAVQDVSEVQQWHITVLIRHEVESTAYTLHTVWTMTNHTPV